MKTIRIALASFSLMPCVSFASDHTCVIFKADVAFPTEVDGRPRVSDGSTVLGYNFDSFESASDAANIIRVYGLRLYCGLFDENRLVLTTFRTNANELPNGSLIEGEHCMSFDRDALEIQFNVSRRAFEVVASGRPLLAAGPERTTAQAALNIINNLEAGSVCNVRGSTFFYFKRM